MNNFKPGDRVRLFESREEGIVTKVLGRDMIEVEIEPGFGLPLSVHDVVWISHQETQKWGETKSSGAKIPTVVSESKPIAQVELGIYLSFVEIGEGKLELLLTNNTDFGLMVGLSNEYKGLYSGKWKGFVASKSSEETISLKKSEHDQWAQLYIQVAYFAEKSQVMPSPRLFSYLFKPSVLARPPKKVPFTEKLGQIIALDEPIFMENAQMIQEKWQEGKKAATTSSLPKKSTPSPEIDLHIEELTQHYKNMQPSEMLRLQLSHFENALHNALASGMVEITFIHGVGAGVLKNEIHKKLGTYADQKDIKYFEDARRDKFGYGATYVRLK